jgi:hypothetical protein
MLATQLLLNFKEIQSKENSVGLWNSAAKEKRN